MRHTVPTRRGRAWCCGLALAACGGAGPARADPAPDWMVTATGGAIDREGDGQHGYGAAALTRRLGRGYLRAGLTRFGSAVAQVDVTLPSTYTLASVAAGTSLGRWFVDGYGTAGVQHFRPIRTALGPRPVRGATNSVVVGAGGDAGYAHRFGRDWSLTPSVSAQWIRSQALREGIGPLGPEDYRTRETGATIGATLRLDRWLGRDRTSGVGLHATRYATTNLSAALVSGARGAGPTAAAARRADGWTELGGNGTARLTAALYADLGLSRTVGAAAGDVTLTSVGLRVLF